ncbi:hypothetical protein [Burkholderia gladioli]|uniref:hypothetical protein n=1 Tax=Burkholderia gladioli TaxID=28095 RepID=UPI001FC810D2|nr:hypothetical protein [Burkholderia gladioli]
MGFTLGRHPLERLRGRLRADRLLPARKLAQFCATRNSRACGILAVRQRPGATKGILFITLEDETNKPT